MDDIVNRLRDAEGGYGFLGIVKQAADEIERLREELTASHESHGNEVGALTERLSLAIQERDEARRWLCHVLSKPEFVTGLAKPGKGRPQDFAIENGWDCYKETKNG